MVWAGRSSPMIGYIRQRLPKLLFEIKIQDQAYLDGVSCLWSRRDFGKTQAVGVIGVDSERG